MSSVDPYDLCGVPPAAAVYGPAARPVAYAPVAVDYNGWSYGAIAVITALILIVVIINLFKFKNVPTVTSPFGSRNRLGKPSLTRGARSEVAASATP